MQNTLINDETIDDLFAPRRQAQAPALAASRACSYCGLPYKVALDYDGPAFCEGCRADLRATKANTLRDLAVILTRMDAAIEAFDQQTVICRPEWEKIQEARIKVDAGQATEAQLKARWEARRAEGGSWQRIIEAHEERDRALAQLGAERARLERALECLEGL